MDYYIVQSAIMTLQLYYCVECGMVRPSEEGLEVVQCKSCQKETEFKELPFEKLKLISPVAANKKLRDVYKLFTRGELNDLDFLEQK